MQAPRLNPLQQAWLQELGLDKRMLARFVAPLAGPESTTEQVAQVMVQPSVPKPVPPQVTAILPRRVKAEPAEPAVVVKPAQPIPQVWDDLIAHVAQCQACELHKGRSHAVAGTGALSAPEWMVVGEAPGSVDDRTGLPFQGKAGQLLQAMLASIQVTGQTTVFYTNLIKCRPLGNRTPTPEEIAACLPYLQRQIALIAPRRILALGGLAAQALLGVEDDLEALRGKEHTMRSEDGRSIPVIVTYHPAALLLRPQHKLDAWRDLSLAAAVPAADSQG
ncbi:uracil-DNA glycosylase [Pusillimonas sp. MFBS29]|uniref:uracil-DNA glycosylase n=1 Tax=Pusillimonas sp. MFBS29 TaxID=2886690 RepID=UPI001D1077D5|nr:uracil-DNA glycosylase [Pusillimonas sp. MFBS29]MCC2595107.1 uracil-DNA glycosylase [Pusillimonas sp. MFBS29]